MNDARDQLDPTGHNSPRLSSRQLADFLAHLADLYGSAEYGNPALSAALRELAAEVRKRSPKASASRPRRQQANPDPAEIESLKQYSDEEVKAFLADKTKTKAQLLKLAAARFSMPVSQLGRLKAADIRQTIMAALLHENSIDILAEQADRIGSNRSS